MMEKIRWGIAKSCMAVAAGFMLIGMKAMPGEVPDIASDSLKHLATNGSIGPDEILGDVMDEEQIEEMKEMREARDRQRIKEFLRDDDENEMVEGVGTCTECGHKQETRVVKSVGMGMETCDECGHEFVVERR